MSQGIEKNFNAYRLRLARYSHGLTKKDLAGRVGVSSLTLTRLEKGETQPQFDTVRALVKVLDFPWTFFFEGSEEEYQGADQPVIENLSFRSRSTLSVKDRNIAYATKNLGRILDEWIQQYFNLPKVALPDYSEYSDIEAAAMALRYEWGLGNQPVHHLLKLLEAKGVRIFCYAEPTERIDAFSYWYNGIPYIFVNTKTSAERIRFDLSHELGHLVLHKNIEQYNDKGNTRETIEKEANQFASAFLMPEADIRSQVFRSIATMDFLIEAKQRWQVSLAALAHRLAHLDIISPWNYRMLIIDMQKKGFRKEEPNPIPHEYSQLWEKIFQELWKERVTRSDLANRVHMTEKHLNKLVQGLLKTPEGHSDQKQIVALKVVDCKRGHSNKAPSNNWTR